MNETQKQVYKIVLDWTRSPTSKTPITLKDIISKLPDLNPRNIRTASETLCSKGYFRRGMNIKNNSCYILLRTIPNVERED